MSVTNIELQDELEQPLIQLAEKLNQSRNWIINEARAIEEQCWQDT